MYSFVDTLYIFFAHKTYKNLTFAEKIRFCQKYSSQSMNIESSLKSAIKQALSALFQVEEEVVLQPTKSDFEGNYTFVVFPLVKQLRKSPADIANAIAEYLKSNTTYIKSYNVVQGFLNLVLADEVWFDTLNGILAEKDFGILPDNNQAVMVEYSSPNTNKPLHLGHLRNNFLGFSVSR